MGASRRNLGKNVESVTADGRRVMQWPSGLVTVDKQRAQRSPNGTRRPTRTFRPSTEADAIIDRYAGATGKTRSASIDDLVRRNDALLADISARRGAPVAPRLDMTPGEWASLYIRSKCAPGAERSQAQHELDTLMRTVATDLSTDITGVIPTLITGDVVKFVDANRYAVNASRSLPMPAAGSSFKRPRVTQRTTAAAQSPELTDLSSQKLTITGDSVSKSVVGGALEISEPAMDWSDPAFLQIAIEDLADSYAIDTESATTSAIEAGATHTTPFNISTANAADTIASIALGAQAVYSNSKKLPDTIYAGVGVWGFLAGLTDGMGRPLFPNLAPMNAPGTLDLSSFAGNPMGLRLCVSPEFSTNFFAVAASRFVETYEQDKGLIQLVDPTVLGLKVAYRGYFATNVYAQGLCSLQ
jgi:hypothetical protein